MGIRIVKLEETKRDKFEKELRGIIIFLFILAILNVFISKRFTIKEIGVFISIFFLWCFFEWIIKLNRVLHRIENAKSFKEFLVAFIELLVLIIRKELFNRIKNFIFRIWNRVSNL